MISHAQTQARSVILVGLILKFASPLVWLLHLAFATRMWVFLPPYVLGTGVYLWGCGAYAVAKHRHRAWAWTGLLCVLALPLLAYLEDRSTSLHALPLSRRS